MQSARTLSLIAASGSALLLLGALGFQFIGDMLPCKMCIWQRWPHLVAVVVGVMILLRAPLKFAWIGAIAALTTAAIGFYHAGVEQNWWPGPASCTGNSVGGLSSDELFNQIMNAPLVRCDEIPWSLFGLSMAGWNGIISLALAALWIRAALR